MKKRCRKQAKKQRIFYHDFEAKMEPKIVENRPTNEPKSLPKRACEGKRAEQERKSA